MCSIYVKFYKDLLENNTVMTIKTSIPTCSFSKMADICILEKSRFFSTLAHASLLLWILLSSESNTIL